MIVGFWFWFWGRVGLDGWVGASMDYQFEHVSGSGLAGLGWRRGSWIAGVLCYQVIYPYEVTKLRSHDTVLVNLIDHNNYIHT